MKLSVNGLSFYYGKRAILRDISFELSSGEIFCLLGPNGAGKSTLIKCLAGELAYASGSVRLDGTELSAVKRREFARKVAYIPQSAEPVFPLPVRDFVVMGRTPYKAFFSQPAAADYSLVDEALEALEISQLAGTACTELSGGERQLMLFARALVQSPKLLILDEPTSHLDFGNQIKVLKTVRELAKKHGLCVFMATHAPEHAFMAGTRAAFLNEGSLSAPGTPAQVITEEAVSSSFGVKVRVISPDDDKKLRICSAVMD